MSEQKEPRLPFGRQFEPKARPPAQARIDARDALIEVRRDLRARLADVERRIEGLEAGE